MSISRTEQWHSYELFKLSIPLVSNPPSIFRPRLYLGEGIRLRAENLILSSWTKENGFWMVTWPKLANDSHLAGLGCLFLRTLSFVGIDSYEDSESLEPPSTISCGNCAKQWSQHRAKQNWRMKLSVSQQCLFSFGYFGAWNQPHLWAPQYILILNSRELGFYHLGPEKYRLTRDIIRGSTREDAKWLIIAGNTEQIQLLKPNSRWHWCYPLLNVCLMTGDCNVTDTCPLPPHLRLFTNRWFLIDSRNTLLEWTAKWNLTPGYFFSLVI